MKIEIKQIISNIAPLYNKPNNKTTLETEMLFGEYFEIQERKKGWVFGHNCNDNYEGWIEYKNLGEPISNDHKVSTLQSIVYDQPNIKSKIKFNFFIGSLVKVENIEDEWAKIKLNIDNDYGYICANCITPKSFIKKDWVNVAEKFINTPYKWGGKTVMGIDCSGLLQISLQSSGKNFPRNTSDQFKMDLITIDNKTHLSRGNLVFWKGHVGILQNAKKMLHANQHHMQVFSEDLNVAIDRIKDNLDLTPVFKKFKSNSNFYF